MGIAVTDPFNSMVLPLEVYTRKNLSADGKYIAELAKIKDCSLIICGLPLNENGSESIQTLKTKKFIENLKNSTDIEIQTEDERYTTREADRLLINEGNVSREKRKGIIDKVAACYILENFLQKFNNK